MRKDIVIVIAEDDKGHYTLMKHCLKNAGIRNKIIRLTDGQETLDFLFGNGNGPKRQAGQDYVLLLDLHMPKIHGMEILQKIKETPKLQSIPVIVVTTSKDDEIAEHCYALGCNGHVTKPFFENLVEALEKTAESL